MGIKRFVDERMNEPTGGPLFFFFPFHAVVVAAEAAVAQRKKMLDIGRLREVQHVPGCRLCVAKSMGL